MAKWRGCLASSLEGLWRLGRPRPGKPGGNPGGNPRNGFMEGLMEGRRGSGRPREVGVKYSLLLYFAARDLMKSLYVLIPAAGPGGDKLSIAMPLLMSGLELILSFSCCSGLLLLLLLVLLSTLEMVTLGASERAGRRLSSGVNSESDFTLSMPCPNPLCLSSCVHSVETPTGPRSGILYILSKTQRVLLLYLSSPGHQKSFFFISLSLVCKTLEVFLLSLFLYLSFLSKAPEVFFSFIQPSTSKLYLLHKTSF